MRNENHEPLPLVGAQLVKLRFCRNGKDSRVTGGNGMQELRRPHER